MGTLNDLGIGTGNRQILQMSASIRQGARDQCGFGSELIRNIRSNSAAPCCQNDARIPGKSGVAGGASGQPRRKVQQF
jgi:hypothetical protein